MKVLPFVRDFFESQKDVEIVAPASDVVGYDLNVAESFEKLNPILSNGHRMNPITTIFDPSIPEEVRSVLTQFVQKLPSDRSPQSLSDDELLAALPSRYMQSQPQLDLVREALVNLAEANGIGVSVPENTVSPDDTASGSVDTSSGLTSSE